MNEEPIHEESKLDESNDTRSLSRPDRLPITNVVWGIRKKADYANRIASVKTMQD